jgi:hypothetical protein
LAEHVVGGEGLKPRRRAVGERRCYICFRVKAAECGRKSGNVKPHSLGLNLSQNKKRELTSLRLSVLICKWCNVAFHGHLWLTPAILATWEAEIRRIMVRS